MMNRVFNFSAGPAVLPEPVLARARDELMCWGDSGASVMELSHRSREFVSIAEQAEQDLRDLLSIPADYAVLFLQGGATSQFSFVPHNLLGNATSVDFINTGQWSKKAIAEAAKFTSANTIASTEDSNFSRVPTQDELQFNADAAYVHYTPNETIGGLEFGYVPDAGAVPLVADMSSTILSRPIDVSRFGLIYAGAQKNIGPSGIAVIIVKRSLLNRASSTIPAAFDFAKQEAAGSMLYTPPTFAWYVAGLVFQWLKANGGLAAMAQTNQRKAGKLYAAIDESSYYSNPIDKDCRSWMNVPFVLADAARDSDFLQRAEEAGLHSLKGHRSVGGMRASIYNAMPEKGVDALIEFMHEFERTA